MIYVTSDWRGCEVQRVRGLLKKANFRDNDFCFVLGGVSDGGDCGVDLLEWLMAQYNVELLLGASEKLMLMNEFLFAEDADPAQITPAQKALLARWTALGAAPTVAALKSRKAEEREYIFEYLHDAALFETVSAGGKDFVLTHSGLGGFKPDKKLSEYVEAELLFNTPALTDRYFDHAVTVFGHTPAGELDPAAEGRILRTETWIDVCAFAPGEGGPALLRLDDGAEFYAD